VNPNSKIPALVDKQGPGDKPLRVFESGAILVYLAKKYSTIHGHPDVVNLAKCN